MSEPRIQYAQTTDGVSIAFWTMGEGIPLLFTPSLPFSGLHLEWQIAEWRSWYAQLAEKRKVVRYDSRGSGLSAGGDVTDFSLEALMLDMEAVVDRLGLERFALWGSPSTGPLAITYAARQPERVSHLILWCTYARPSDAVKSPHVQELVRLLIGNWELYTDTVARYNFGWLGGEAARRWGAAIREGVTQENYRAFQAHLSRADVTDLLPQVKAPTLVLHRRQFPLLSADVATDLASRIPNARLLLLEGESGGPALGDSQAVLNAVDELLGEGEEAAARAALPEPGAFRTILFTDVEGSTALTDRLGDARAARELLREHERITRDALKAHGGSEVKALGDGFMASFFSATKALECAIAIQNAFDDRNRSLPAHPEALEGRAEPIRIRIGLNAGEPIAEDDPGGRSDLFGTAVNLAARIAAKAHGGEILASNVVRELVAGKDFLFADQGDAELRGFENPVRVYEVRWREG